jgi:hypothetical protein
VVVVEARQTEGVLHVRVDGPGFGPRDQVGMIADTDERVLDRVLQRLRQIRFHRERVFGIGLE